MNTGKRYELELTDEQRRQLEQARDHNQLPYVRERAAGILKVADGDSIKHVALQGLLKPHHPDTVRSWIRRFLAEGIAGLKVRPGSGRKPAFFPSAARRRSRPPGDPAHRTS